MGCLLGDRKHALGAPAARERGSAARHFFGSSSGVLHASARAIFFVQLIWSVV